METITTIGLALVGGAVGTELWNRGKALHARWIQAEQAVFAHDQAILALALKTNTPICTCGEPDCPANQQQKPDEQHGSYL